MAKVPVIPGADRFTWDSFTVVKTPKKPTPKPVPKEKPESKALTYREKLALLLDKDEHGYGSYKQGEGPNDPPVLKGVDSKANAERETERFLAKWDMLKGARPTPEALKATEAELHELPLVHGTTIQGALGAVTEGLMSHADMKPREKALVQESDDLREEIEGLMSGYFPTEREQRDWSQWSIEEIRGSLGLGRSEAEDLSAKIQELVSIEQILQGTTNPADEKLGLDKFVFMTHGQKHQDYGDVGVIIDNKVIDHGGWATKDDIVIVPGGSLTDQDTGQRAQYNSRRVENYQKQIVKGDDYYKVAAAHAGSPTYLANRSREQLFEIKAPRVPKESVLGFTVEGNRESAQRLADKLAAKGQRNKVLYIGETTGAAQRFMHNQLKSMQTSHRWDEDAYEQFREEHDGLDVAIL